MSFARRIKRASEVGYKIKKPKFEQLHVYGVGCMWHDVIEKAGNTDNFSNYPKSLSITGMPCCPHCGSMLFQKEEQEFWAEAKENSKDEHHNYYSMLIWGQGQCFTDYKTMEEAYLNRSIN